MMTVPAGMVQYNAFVDSSAGSALDALIPNLGSAFLTDTVMTEHDVEGRRVRMRDHANLVLTAELPGRRLLGFVIAEVNPEADRAILHVLYVLRGYRRMGVAPLLLDSYESLLERMGCTGTTVVPMTDRSVALFRRREASSSIKYDLRVPSRAELDYGNEHIAND